MIKLNSHLTMEDAIKSYLNLEASLSRISDRSNIKIDDLIKKHEVDLEKSYSYGDTTGDLSMLRMVGNPIAINPNKKLLYAIKEDKELSEKTKIMVERKDVIYQLDAGVKVF